MITDKNKKAIRVLEENPLTNFYSPEDQIKKELERIKKEEKKEERKDDTFERYAGYREWNKTHDCYKVLYAPDGRDEHGKRIKYD